MQAQVESKEFFRAIEYVAKARARGNAVPLLGGVRIEATPGRIRVAATDLGLMVEAEIPASGDDTWQVLVDPAALKAAKALATGSVVLSVRPVEGRQDLVIQTGPDEETQVVGAAERDLREWPTFHQASGHLYGIAEIGPREIALLPHLLAHRADDVEYRPILSSVYVDSHGWTATDAARLLHVPGRSAEFDGIDGVALPGRSVQMLLASPYAVERVTVRVEGDPPDEKEGPRPRLALLEAGPVRIWTRLVEGRFPAYRSILPTDPLHQFALEPDVFPRIRKVLQAADTLTRRGPGIVRLAFRENQVGLETCHADSGTVRARFPAARWNGTAEAEAAYQAAFLRDMLASFETLGEPVYATLHPTRVGSFVGPSGVTCLIMPWVPR